MSPAIQVEGLAELQATLAELAPALDRSLEEALSDSARMVAERAQAIAPRRSGRMAGSIRPFTEGAASGVSVEARRRSTAYPGGYPYPTRIERIRPFLRPAVEQESREIDRRMVRVIDDVAEIWRG